MSEEESDPEFKGPIAPDNRISNWWYFGIFLLILFILAGIATPVLVGHKPRPSSKGIQEMKHIGYALFNFEKDLGSYPNDKTAIELAEKYPDDADELLNPKSADDYFRQLVVTGYLNEGVLEQFKEADVRLTYVVWQDKMPTESAAPLLITPVVKGQRKFDRPYARKETQKRALQLRVDISLSDLRITEDGKAQIHGRTEFFDSSLPWWDEQEWKLAWPE